MKPNPRWFVPLLANVLLLLLLAEVNDLMAVASVYLILAGLLIPFPALQLKPVHGLIVIIPSALLWEGAHPSPFTLGFVGILALYAVATGIRFRLRREDRQQAALLAVLLNAAFIVGLSIVLAGAQTLQPVYWSRVFTDLLLSSLVLLPVAFWFFDLQRASLQLLNVDIQSEDVE
ncbi:MAG: hypothetical protein ACFE0O_05040 [Opitutales bacterium]